MADSKYPGYEDGEKRAAYVGALKNELAHLEGDPEKNGRRINEVKDQLDVYSDEPKQKRRETATKTAAAKKTAASGS